MPSQTAECGLNETIHRLPFSRHTKSRQSLVSSQTLAEQSNVHSSVSSQSKVEQSNGLPQDSSSAVHFFAQLSNYEIERDSLVVNFQARVTLDTWTGQIKEPHSASSQLLEDGQLPQAGDEVTDGANKASDGVGIKKI